MPATIFESPHDLNDAVGKHLGYSGWLTMEQDRVDKFADATNDHQWIHVDAERAKTGPFGATIAHGYLTLSLVSSFMPEIFEVRGFEFAVNYGTNKVRFPAPVKVGQRIRGGAEIFCRGGQGRHPFSGSRHRRDRGRRPAGLHCRAGQPLLPEEVGINPDTGWHWHCSCCCPWSVTLLPAF